MVLAWARESVEELEREWGEESVKELVPRFAVGWLVQE